MCQRAPRYLHGQDGQAEAAMTGTEILKPLISQILNRQGPRTIDSVAKRGKFTSVDFANSFTNMTLGRNYLVVRSWQGWYLHVSTGTTLEVIVQEI